MSGFVIKQVMRKCGELHISAKQLAAETGISVSTISIMFNGNYEIYDVTESKLVEWLSSKGGFEMDEITTKRLTDLLDHIEQINDNPWIKGKRRFAKWLGVSYPTLDKMLKDGLPVHFITDVDAYFFNKQEVNKYLLEQ